MILENLTESQRRLKLEELKLVADEFRYRDQLMVTEFALTMTAVGLALNLARMLTEGQAFIVVLLTMFFLLIVSRHLSRVNRDHTIAGQIKNDLLKLFDMEPIAQDYTYERPYKYRATRLMVWFSYTIFVIVLVYALILCKALLIDSRTAQDQKFFAVTYLYRDTNVEQSEQRSAPAYQSYISLPQSSGSATPMFGRTTNRPAIVA